MVTGIETASLVLAILPLLVKLVDNYAKGLSTIRSFGARRHRREMNLYAAELGTQAALLTDSIMLLVEDIVDDTEIFSSGLHQGFSPLMANGKMQERLEKRLGRNFDLYLKTMQALSDTLLDLQSKLGLEADAVQRGTIPTSDQDNFLRAIKKFRDVFSKSMYDDLLARIDRANSSLRTLTENALREEKTSTRRRLQQKPLRYYRTARKYAKTLHTAFLESSCRQCIDKHAHKLNFRIDQDDFARILEGESPDIVFNVALLSQITASASTGPSAWSTKELKIVSVKLDSASPKALLNLPGSQVQKAKLYPHKKVAFALAVAPPTCIPWPIASTPSVNLCEQDICSELVSRKLYVEPQECLGFFGRDLWEDHRHDVYLVGDLPTQPPSRPLLDSLIEAQSAPLWQATRHSLKLWTNRLRIAVILALGVMKLHGTWLRPFWKLKDVLVVDDGAGPQSQDLSPSQRLYLEWDVLQQLDMTQLSPSPTKSPLIRSDLLFPLGLALIELALCEPIDAMRKPEDADPIESVAELKAALRLVDDDIISLHCGQRYGDVVRVCLFWTGKKDADLEDVNAQQMVWEKVALPLIEDLCAAEGRTQT